MWNYEGGNMNIIKHRYIFLGVSGALVLASVAAVGVFGLREGIDLRGGTEWRVAFSDRSVAGPRVEAALAEALKRPVAVRSVGSADFLIRLPDTDEVTHQELAKFLTSRFGGFSERSFLSIGPSVGGELRGQALTALLFVLVGISLYVAWAFRKVSGSVRSWKYGVSALVTLFHDVSIPTGMLAVLGAVRGVEVDTNFIVALLVVMGFSVHDTIVVFDRIREHLLNRQGAALDAVINESVRETLGRSINTSLTLVLVLIALLFWGPPALFYFILTILVGTLVGTYSSICVASPLLYIWDGGETKR